MLGKASGLGQGSASYIADLQRHQSTDKQGHTAQDASHLPTIGLFRPRNLD